MRGVLAPVYLLDFLRFFVLFEDDGTLVKKIVHENWRKNYAKAPVWIGLCVKVFVPT
ncbi:MAG: hypothetical protein Q7T96_04730 [Methylobacter sp.]|nr:hypothetical protein [Methylobacter sp.]